MYNGSRGEARTELSGDGLGFGRFPPTLSGPAAEKRKSVNNEGEKAFVASPGFQVLSVRCPLISFSLLPAPLGVHVPHLDWNYSGPDLMLER